MKREDDLSGRWVFVPRPKWETLPASFYSMRLSRIYLRLWLNNVPPPLVDWCMEKRILPPRKLKGLRLIHWIERRQNRGGKKALSIFPKVISTGNSFEDVTRQASGSRL